MPLPSHCYQSTKEIRPVFSTDYLRLLLLDGSEGTVACRVHGHETAGTIPRLSEADNVEFATRTLLRMKNLSAVRGSQSGARMVGPADYYGNLEKPDEVSYTIEIQNGKPMFFSKPLTLRAPIEPSLRPVPHGATKSIRATWISGSNKQLITAKKAEYESHGNQPFGESLFPNSGILEIHNEEEIRLPSFDPTGVDISSFKARLVPNHSPFQITSEPLKSTDEYRAVSFLYEPNYALNQVENGGGLFLETHDFAQTMTPLDTSAKGFVNLAKWIDEEHTQLELIAIQIPFVWTLIIEKDCIHGDATLEGMFMMCMTTNHTSMQTADSVFLKHPESGNNVLLKVDALEQDESPQQEPIAPRPFAIYSNDDNDAIHDFFDKTKEMNFIFNPFSMGYWKIAFSFIKEALYTASNFCVACAMQLVQFVQSLLFNSFELEQNMSVEDSLSDGSALDF